MKLSKAPLGKCNIINKNNHIEVLSLTNSIIMTKAGIYIYNFAANEILKRIEYIIHYYMKKSNSIEVKFPTLQHADHWKMAGRENGYGNETFVINNKEDTWFLAPTAEEQACLLIKDLVCSYKNLPLIVYQITDKFRNEMRPRGGLLRSKQFGMKDAYSFCSTPYEQSNQYVLMMNTYIKIFNELGLKGKYIINFTDDTGEIGGSLSHEFLVLCEDGDRELFIEPQTYTYFNNIQEIQKIKFDTSIISYKYIEAGHLFDLEQIYSSKMNITFQSPSNVPVNYHMGCYGIGTTRLLQIITNSLTYLPMSISPCFIYLVAKEECELYSLLLNIYGLNNVWFNDTHSTLAEKIRLKTYLRLPLMIIYDIIQNNLKIEVHHLDKITIFNSIQETIQYIQSIYAKTNYINLNHFISAENL